MEANEHLNPINMFLILQVWGIEAKEGVFLRNRYRGQTKKIELVSDNGVNGFILQEAHGPLT